MLSLQTKIQSTTGSVKSTLHLEEMLSTDRVNTRFNLSGLVALKLSPQTVLLTHPGDVTLHREN
jgi:hypothetical protein